MMPGNISPPPHGPQGGPLGKSVGSVFHGLGSPAMAPKPGHRLAPGPAPRPPGAPVQLGMKGAPISPYGHMPSVFPGAHPPQQAPGGMAPGPY